MLEPAVHASLRAWRRLPREGRIVRSTTGRAAYYLVLPAAMLTVRARAIVTAVPRGGRTPSRSAVVWADRWRAALDALDTTGDVPVDCWAPTNVPMAAK